RCQQALADYLTIRPHCSNPRLFLTLRAPWRPLTKTILDKRVRWRLKERFGNSLPAYGCHVLRHSFAKAMLDRGAPLSHISVLLGHQALQSTYVYTRISIEEMREVADNYACLLVPPQIDKPAIAHQ
ncbi:MAG: tyrosine-type recombinase/integrase, partial [Elusimicrobia bacterium]|nr:tyrosine-type recombinase/integrase [Elusimicrobiota bacterium]